MITDTHCHLDDSRFDNDLESVIARAEAVGVNKFIIPGADPKTIDKAVDIAESYGNVWFSVGVHPYDAKNYSPNLIEKYIGHDKCVAVGECGLDYYRLPEDAQEADAEISLQKEVFISQIKLAKKYCKPLIVHIRDASLDSRELLLRYSGDRGGVLHCYNANRELLKLAERGFYYGIGGVITFKNARRLVETYPMIATDRLLVETDSPYLTPHPHRGERNEPAYCRFILEKMAQLSDKPVDEMERICEENTERLFRI